MICFIVDYGMGNLRSIQHKLVRIGVQASITSDVEDILKATLLILPGVGNFARGMQNLREYALITVLNRKVLIEKTPIMGICLGMQLFAKCSEEGNCEGLGWIDGEVEKLKPETGRQTTEGRRQKTWSCERRNYTDPQQTEHGDKISGSQRLRVPHVGWNTIDWKRESPLRDGLGPDQEFYFVHSYHMVCQNPDDVLTTTDYGGEFVSSVHRGNIFGVQFHPEKSHFEGMKVISNFLRVSGPPC